MPRELIHAAYESDGYSAVVSWGKETSSVQVGLKACAKDDNVILKGQEYDSLWINMNREQLNRMIRILRRARDQAYGRDE